MLIVLTDEAKFYIMIFAKLTLQTIQIKILSIKHNMGIYRVICGKILKNVKLYYTPYIMHIKKCSQNELKMLFS